MQSLSTEAQARLAAFRRAESPDAGAAERCLAGLERRLAEPAPRRRVAAIAVAAAALALAAGIVLTLRWAWSPNPQREEAAVAAPYQSTEDVRGEVVAPERRVQAHESATPAAPSLAQGVAEAVTSVPDEEAASAAREVRPGVKRTRASADDLAEEVRLLREAKLAEPARRLGLLDELARRFPNGALAAERVLLTIEGRCALGEGEVARAMARQFTRRFPGSSLAARAAKVCAEGTEEDAATP